MLILLTAHFPFHPGEQFLEEEIKWWEKGYKKKLVIMPGWASGQPRKVPSNCIIDCTLAEKASFFTKLFAVCRALMSSLFWREVLFIWKMHRSEFFSCLKIGFWKTQLVFVYYCKLKKVVRRGEEVTIYSYWNDTLSFAAALLRKQQMVKRLICRAHRFDVYEYSRPYGYMALKRQFVKSFDQVHAISNEGRNYLMKEYGFTDEVVLVSRLGVAVEEFVNVPSQDPFFVILSLSYCVPVKRIDKIIQAIAKLKDLDEERRIKWCHIGSGPELMKLQSQAKEVLFERGVEWCFHGELPNNAVHQFLRNESIDVLVNTSDSEGVPVSIMEAMSYGIPVIAPSIGGIAELVNRQTGVLLPPIPDIDSIARALSNYGHFKNPQTRIAAKEHIAKQFNAERNYPSFIETLSKLQSKSD